MFWSSVLKESGIIITNKAYKIAIQLDRINLNQDKHTYLRVILKGKNIENV